MAFRAHLKVCFGDIDNAGIVYYPRFLHYFHVALEEFFSNELGVEYATVLGKHRIAFPTVHLQVDFRRRLRFGDHIEVEVEVVSIGSTSVTWGYRTRVSGQEDVIVAEGHNVTVCMNMDRYEKSDIPEWLREALESYRNSCK